MTTHPNSKDHLVAQPAIQLFAAFEWQTISARVVISERSIMERTGHA